MLVLVILSFLLWNGKVKSMYNTYGSEPMNLQEQWFPADSPYGRAALASTRSGKRRYLICETQLKTNGEPTLLSILPNTVLVKFYKAIIHHFIYE